MLSTNSMRGRLLALSLLLLAFACKHDPPLGPSPFRFSPRPNRAAEIHWRVWDASVFAEAERSGRPILLSLAAVWCHWCHVLDETTLSNPTVIARLNADFLPVRVDADQHPDLERRYILGGWPTVAFLTAKGEIIDGGTYVPPDQFLQMLDGALTAARAGGPTLEARLQRHRQHFDPTRAGPLEPTIVEGVARSLTGAADLQYGGFGGAPKFPNGDAVVLLLDVGEREVAKRALDGMLKLEDPIEGGFYRYATRADWTVPHFEKMLQGNAELLAAYARGFALLGDERYRAVCRRTVAYLTRTLIDAQSGAPFASQDADERYSAADAQGRAALNAPYIDRTLLVDRAAKLVQALADAAHDLGGSDTPALLALAHKVAASLLTMRAGDGRLFHARRPGVAPEVSGQLADQAYAALALLSLAAADPTNAAPLREAATRALDGATRTLAAPTGGFYDAEPGTLGLLTRRERPLEENAIFARALLRAGRRAEAERTLSAFAGAYLLYGTQAAGYARAVREFLEPAGPGR